MQLEQKFKKTISKYNLLKKGDRIITAVSGGPDSVCLLFLLNHFKNEFNLHLHIATLNHLIRKKDAREDIEFVKKLAEKFNLPLTVGEADVPKFAKTKKLSLEEAARVARFGFLKEIAAKNGAKKIALGHNLDDQVETFLMRLIRGAGLAGLCGISALRKEGEFDLIRPLIEISRKEIEAFLKQKNLSWRIDKTNQSLSHLRNKIRLQLIPSLEKEYNPKIKEGILRSAHNIKEAHNFLEKKVDDKIKKILFSQDGKIKLKLEPLKDTPWILKTKILRRAVLQLKGNLRQFTYENWTALERLAFTSQSGKKLSLPANIIVRKIYHTLVFEKKAPEEKEVIVKKQKINYPRDTLVAGLNIKISSEILKQIPKAEKNKWVEFFDADKISWPIFVRVKEEKDVFKPLGMRGKKALKDFFIDVKVPVTLRNKVPILEDKKRIIWVGGLRISDEVKVTPRTKRILKLRISR